ncbi:hypothetical protein [Roseateles amylovorans]|uniref:Uncharacterized protein n=1 Tax=Roseateles amylovorans TaxID=2978473 RepID=A0ABY6AZP6_9BURK|nr:hypothetical protein [Roseateles amylovorans]UXH78167.1 hypothetical protein N4261_24985 [Roseateles amylovorans]
MNATAKTFFTALAAVVSAAVIAVWLADQTEAVHRAPTSTQWATQTLPGTQAEQASKPRG